MSVLFLALFIRDAHAACTVTLSQPAAGARVSAAPTFRWTASGDCSQYRVQLAKASTFPSAGTTSLSWVSVQRETMAASTYTTLTSAGTTAYYWRVQSRDSAATTANSASRRLTLAATDADHDGYTARTYGGTDCDDGDAAVHPGASETCNGVDDDCDGRVDGDAVDATTYYLDTDADGYGDATSIQRACTLPSGYAADATDCDDTNAGTHPGAKEACWDGVDQDCDASLNCDLLSASSWGGGDEDAAVELAYDYTGDGVIDGADAAAAHYWYPNFAYNLDTCDVNGDGALDVILGNGTYTSLATGTLHLFLGPIAEPIDSRDADATFSVPGISPQYHPLSCGDVTGDGMADIAVTDLTGDEVYVFAAPFSGAYTTADATAVIEGETMTVDWTAWNGYDHACGNGSLDWTPGLGSEGIEAGSDVDGDGIGDLIVSAPGYLAKSAYYLFVYDDAGNPCADETLVAGAVLYYPGPVTGALGVDDANGWSGTSRFGVVGDLYDEGWSDVALASGGGNSPDEGGVWIERGTWASGLAEPSDWDLFSAGFSESTPVGYTVWPMSVQGDLTGDGTPDYVFLATDWYTEGHVSATYYVMPGSLSTGDAETDAAATIAITLAYENSFAETADINGDGYPDLAVGPDQSLDTPVFAGPLSGDLTTADALGSAGPGIQFNSLGDVNGDGRDEMIFGGDFAANVVNGE